MSSRPSTFDRRASAIGFGAPVLAARGHLEIEARVARAFTEFVAPGDYRFRSRGNVGRLRDVVKFNWEMVSTATDTVAAVGLDVFTLDDRGRIAVDYQFIES